MLPTFEGAGAGEEVTTVGGGDGLDEGKISAATPTVAGLGAEKGVEAGVGI